MSCLGGVWFAQPPFFWGRFPSLFEKDGKLIKIENPMAHAIKTNNYISFDKKEDAVKFAKGSWKKFVK